MKLDFITVGACAENTYFLIDENTKETIVVDPGGGGMEIESYLKENNLKPVKVINTHGHIDHIEANGHMKSQYNIPVLMHPVESKAFGILLDEPLEENDIIEFAGENIKVLLTPGHTMGSICLLADNFMLTGDTLFAGSMGRTDLGGDEKTMMKTLVRLAETVPDETVLYPGHGPRTTMGKEKRTNPFLLQAMNT